VENVPRHFYDPLPLPVSRIIWMAKSIVYKFRFLRLQVIYIKIKYYTELTNNVVPSIQISFSTHKEYNVIKYYYITSRYIKVISNLTS